MHLAISASLAAAVLGFAATPGLAGDWSQSNARVSWNYREAVQTRNIGDIALPMSFFDDTGGVGSFIESADGGGGGGGFIAASSQASAGAFASASARANVEIRFQKHARRSHGASHSSGCGCK